jgi:hypothetical protein
MPLEFGKLLIILGIVLLTVGLLLTFAGRLPWLGRLPGDFSYEGERFRFYFPLGTSILISLVLSLLLWLFRR